MGVVCVFSIFDAGGSVCGCMCMCTHAHTHCTHGLLGCEPRSRDETPGGPEESRWTKSWHTHIRMCVQITHVCMYMLRGGMGSWTNSAFFFNIVFFRKRKAKDVNAYHR